MRDELVALLEEKPYTLKELSALLGASWFGVRDQVAYLEATKQVKTSRRGREVLVSLRLTPIENVTVTKNGRYRRSPRDVGAKVDELLGIRESNTGVAVCAAAGCGKRFTPDRRAERFCSERCRAVGPPTSRRTVVVDGVEFEAISVAGHPLGEWPTTDIFRGSSLLEATEIRRP